MWGLALVRKNLARSRGMGLPETREDCALSDRLEIGSEPAKGKVEGAGKLNDAPDELSCRAVLVQYVVSSVWFELRCGAVSSHPCRAVGRDSGARLNRHPAGARPSFTVVARASGGDKWNAIRQAIRAGC